MHLVLRWEDHVKDNQNAFDKSVRSTPNNFLLSVTDFHFSSTDTRQCWAIRPFLNSHWCLEKKNFQHTFWVLFMNRCYICHFQQWWIWGGINTAIKIWENEISKYIRVFLYYLSWDIGVLCCFINVQVI